MKRAFLLAVVMLGSGAPPTVEKEGDEILGTWVTAQTPIGRAHAEIVRSESTYEGQITWLESAVFGANDPKGMAGQPLVDRENPNPSLRMRPVLSPVLGLKILKGFRYTPRPEHGGTSAPSPHPCESPSLAPTGRPDPRRCRNSGIA